MLKLWYQIKRDIQGVVVNLRVFAASEDNGISRARIRNRIFTAVEDD
jgi:hypothetical protein